MPLSLAFFKIKSTTLDSTAVVDDNVYFIHSLTHRVDSTLELLQEAIPTFENNEFLRKSLLDLKKLFERIEDLLQLCLPKDNEGQKRISKTVKNAAHIAKRVLFSEQNLKTLKEYSEMLDRIKQDFSGHMQLAAKQQANRVEDVLQAMRLTLDTRTDPLLKLAKRHLNGNVIEEELVELQESLGSGSFGMVMAGKYYGKPVAIKRALKGFLSADEREAFR